MTDLLEELKALRAELADLRAKFSAPMAGALTIRQAAARMECSAKTVARMVSTGVLKSAPRAGREARVTLASVIAWEEGPHGATPERAVKMVTAPKRFDAQEELAKLDLALERSRNVTGVRHGPSDELNSSRRRRRAL